MTLGQCFVAEPAVELSSAQLCDNFFLASGFQQSSQSNNKVPLCSETYVRQHSFKCWSAFHRPRKTTVIYIILSTVLFSSGHPTFHKPTAEKLDLAESPFSFSSGPGAEQKSLLQAWNQHWNQPVSMHKPQCMSQNVEYEHKTAQCGTREFPKNRAISLVWNMGVLGSTGVAHGGLMLVNTWSCFSFLIQAQPELLYLPSFSCFV